MPPRDEVDVHRVEGSSEASYSFNLGAVGATQSTGDALPATVVDLRFDGGNLKVFTSPVTVTGTFCPSGGTFSLNGNTVTAAGIVDCTVVATLSD